METLDKLDTLTLADIRREIEARRREAARRAKDAPHRGGGAAFARAQGELEALGGVLLLLERAAP